MQLRTNRVFATRFMSSTTTTPAASSESAAASSSSRSSPPPPPSSGRRSKNRKGIVLGLTLFASAGFLFPFYMYHRNQDSHFTASKPLNPQQVIRGAYLNSSTRDMGPDPAWQAKHGITRIEGRNQQ